MHLPSYGEHISEFFGTCVLVVTRTDERTQKCGLLCVEVTHTLVFCVSAVLGIKDSQMKIHRMRQFDGKKRVAFFHRSAMLGYKLTAKSTVANCMQELLELGI